MIGLLISLVLAVAVIYYRFWNVSCLKSCPLLKAHKPLVIGIGLPRTGTSSLTCAMKMLGFATHHFPLHFDLKSDTYMQKKNCLIDWVTLGYRPLQLEAMFPNALFIYTHRDEVSWINSMHYLKKLLLLCPNIRRRFIKVFGDDWSKFKIDFENEIKLMKTKKILWLNLCKDQKWEPLAEFLNIPCPDVPFPRKKEIFLQLEQILIHSF